ncbi:hypothetical protein CALCODRAFT_329089 [Calocera cornea HHB12733]|uniref:Uncharacterized protein n=1 Tax=Calocera cornea HHB12733 TaxID=1353952 RepID=A0A165JIQ0_9BASI|nr:hypothetical protein CALCODRAFT_329089 [Calocera cornea HHB12733]
MGTSAWTARRYRGWYFVEYYHDDGYPSHRGIIFIREIPADPNKFKDWSKRWQDYLEEQLIDLGLDETKEMGYRHGGSSFEYFIQRGRPRQVPEWVYEHDFDNNALCINFAPVFNLDNMPPTRDLILQGIGINSYGYQATSRSISSQYRYIPPCQPMVPAATEDLQYYCDHAGEQAIRPIHELLCQSQSLTSRERAREAFLGAIMGQYLISRRAARTMPWLSERTERTSLPPAVISAVHHVMSFALSHQVFVWTMSHSSSIPNALSITWYRSDMFLYVATGLDQEDQLQAVIAHVSRVLQGQPAKRGSVFGVLCSFLHVVIVQVSILESDITFSHTQVMPFRPDLYATSPITAGITAVARLSARSDLSFMIQRPSNLVLFPTTVSVIRDDQLLPSEIWIAIAQHLFDADDLLALGCTAHQCRVAVAEVLRDITLPGMRIESYQPTEWSRSRHVDVSDAEPDDQPEQDPQSEGDGTEPWDVWHPSLYHASFNTINDVMGELIHVTSGDSGSTYQLLMEMEGPGFYMPRDFENRFITMGGIESDDWRPGYFYDRSRTML